MKRLISCVLALLYIMAGFASGTWILHGKEYRVDTLYHAYIGPGTTQTSIKLAGPVNLRVFYTTTDLKNENVDVRAIKHKDTLTGLVRYRMQRNRTVRATVLILPGSTPTFFRVLCRVESP